ncbi:MAG: hypothetical protein JKX97_03085 [Candidatus Lindowbacteria bacterium]|nr:hypothetical protein [Candidatus Lindowbacteria bacterium]
MKSTLKKMALTLFSLIFALFLAELAVRGLPLLPITSMGLVMQQDPILDHSLRPFSRGRMKSREYDVTYEINSFGLRDVEPEEGSVMILGDSFMEGYGVKESDALAALLRSKGMKIVNAGVKSYSPLLEYLYLKHRGLKLKPSKVILFFDLSDPANDQYYSGRLVTAKDGTPEYITPKTSGLLVPKGRLFGWLNTHSSLFAYVLHRLHKIFPGQAEDLGYTGETIANNLLFAARDSEPDDTYYPRWNKSLSYILNIQDLLKKNNIPFTLVTYPYGHQVSVDAWKEGRRAHHFPDGVSSDRPFRFLEQWSKENDIDFFSLDEVFLSHPEPGSLYFTYDGHWTPEGHRVAANATYDFLSKP